jgi:hypothetical protein
LKADTVTILFRASAALSLLMAELPTSVVEPKTSATLLTFQSTNSRRSTMEYNIDGLTKKQVAILDIMWSLEDQDSVLNFIRSLPEADRVQARGLMTLLMHEVLEEWLEGVTEFPEAKAVIERVQ